MRLTNHSHRYKPPSLKSFTKLTMVATITMGWVPLVMVISIASTKELYYSTNRTTMVATKVLTIVPIEVGLNHDSHHDKSKTSTNRFSKLPDDGDPWAPNNLLKPGAKTTVEYQWTKQQTRSSGFNLLK